MKPEEKINQQSNQSELVRVIPFESPSENFLVTEHLQHMPNLFARGLLYIILLLLAAILIYSLLCKIDVVIECRGVAHPSSHKIRVLSDRSGYIEKIFICEGQEVDKDAPLFLIQSKEAVSYKSRASELRRSIPFKEEYYQNKMAAAGEKITYLQDELANTIRVNRLKLEQNTLSLGLYELDLSYWQKEVANLEKEFDNKQRLFEKQLTSIGEYNQIKSRLDLARTEVKKIISQKAITQKDNAIIEGEINHARLTCTHNIKELEEEIKNLGLEKETSLQSLKRNLLRSEKAGIISELYFQNEGEYVREADLLGTILPADSSLYMDILVANRDIGFIEPGMDITYKFDAFPYADYGILQGRVLSIAPSTVEDKIKGLIYHIKGTLGQSYYQIKDKRYPLKAGMTATAELITEKKSIFSILFRKWKR